MTPDDAARITELRASGMTWLQVAGEMGVSDVTLWCWRKRYAISDSKPPDDKTPNADTILALRQQGKPWRAVAGEIGVTLETLRVWRHQLGLPVPQRARIMPHGWPTPRMRAIEAEYDEPLRDVITVFRAMGYDWPTIAGALDMSERQLYVWRKRLGLPVPRRGGNNARLAN